MSITMESQEMISVGFCPQLWQEKAEEFASGFSAIKDFKYTWRRWKNWDNGKYPVIISRGNSVLGIHAATFSERSGYVNSYYQAVSEELQGMRMGGSMVSFILSKAFEMKLSRLKMKTPEGSPGHRFWSGFGLKPYAKKDGVLYWDNDIKNVANVSGLIEWMKHKDAHSPIPMNELKRVAKSGVQFL